MNPITYLLDLWNDYIENVNRNLTQLSKEIKQNNRNRKK